MLVWLETVSPMGIIGMEDTGIKASGILTEKEEVQKNNALPVQAGFGGLTAAIHSGFGIESPFTREIFLTKQAIVGMRFQGGSDQLTGDMKPGDRITFVREPENRFDHNAIMALDSQGRKLG